MEQKPAYVLAALAFFALLIVVLKGPASSDIAGLNCLNGNGGDGCGNREGSTMIGEGLDAETTNSASVKKKCSDYRMNKYCVRHKECVWVKGPPKFCRDRTSSDPVRVVGNSPKKGTAFLASNNALNMTYAKELEEDFERVFASLNLDQVQCIPKVCEKTPSFLNESSWKTRPGVFLASLPGAGNTWTRAVIREGTRVYTGSVYTDNQIYKKGFLGEILHNPRVEVSVIKTHWPALGGGEYHHGVSVNAAIHIIRAPFDAYVSEFNRQKGHGHTSEAGVWFFKNTFKHWLSVEGYKRPTTRSFRWTDMFDKYTGIADFIKSDSIPIVVPRYVVAGRSKPIPVLNIYYEDLVTDFVRTSAKMFWFLKRRLGDSMPSVRDSVLCAMSAKQKQEKFHRKSSGKKYNPFIELPGLGKQACEVWEPWWNEVKWGKCTGEFQNERADRVYKSSPTLPSEFCEN